MEISKDCKTWWLRRVITIRPSVIFGRARYVEIIIKQKEKRRKKKQVIIEIKTFQGMKFEDNTDSVQTYTAGQQVPLYFNIRAPHSGYANVSIIDTTSNSMIAANLSAWDEYALTSIPAKTEWTVCFLLLPIYFLHLLTYIFFLQQNFTITIPSDIGTQCSTAGKCAIQMHWNAPPPVDQTYQSCIDFTVGASGGSNASSKKRNVAKSFAA